MHQQPLWSQERYCEHCRESPNKLTESSICGLFHFGYAPTKSLSRTARQLLQIYPTFTSFFTSPCSYPTAVAPANEHCGVAYKLKQQSDSTNSPETNHLVRAMTESDHRTRYSTRKICFVGHSAHPEVDCILNMAVSKLVGWSIVNETKPETCGVSPYCSTAETSKIA